MIKIYIERLITVCICCSDALLVLYSHCTQHTTAKHLLPLCHPRKQQWYAYLMYMYVYNTHIVRNAQSVAVFSIVHDFIKTMFTKDDRFAVLRKRRYCEINV